MSDLTELTALPVRLGERFALGELIGRGAGSRVHRAHDTLLDRPAAVKVFPVADDPRARREVRLLAALDHPGLVPVYDVEEVDGRAVVVTALYEGGSLADRLVDGPLELGDALLVGASIADALDHVHRSGVLHRAVTPTNVLFDDDGRAHLADFGVALIADAPRITDTGDVVGRPHYLAPEQVRGGAVGTPADVYALGLVLVETLTGRRAFPGDPLPAARERLERSPEVPGTLPSDVAGLVAAMTAADPASRPRADEVTVGLRRAALAAEVMPIAVVPTPRRPMLARGAVVVGGVAMSAVLAGTVVFASTRPLQEVSATLPPTAATAAPAPAAPRLPFSGDSSDSGSDSGSSESSGSGSSDSASSDAGTPVLAQAQSASGTSGLAGRRTGTSLAADSSRAASTSSQAPSTSSQDPSTSAPASSTSSSSTSSSSTSSSSTSSSGHSSDTPDRDTSDRDTSDRDTSGDEASTGTEGANTEDHGLVGDLLGDTSDDDRSRGSGHREHQGGHERHGDDQDGSADHQRLLDGLL